jgi:hypothetical protein
MQIWERDRRGIRLSGSGLRLEAGWILVGIHLSHGRCHQDLLEAVD